MLTSVFKLHWIPRMGRQNRRNPGRQATLLRCYAAAHTWSMQSRKRRTVKTREYLRRVHTQRNCEYKITTV